MMNVVELIFLSIALAMDCFTVSIVSGVMLRRSVWPTILRMGFLFGLFQAAMPFIGWLATAHFAHYIEAIDHWVAFGLLAFIGAKMIADSMKPAEEHHFNPRKLKTQLILAVATSIDALAVGISFACTGYRAIAQMSLPLLLIGLGSFFFSIIGNLLGIRFGSNISRRLKPELLGGIVLLCIGIRILVTHLAE